MSFEKDSQKFVACIIFIETIKPRKKDIDPINVIDLVSPSEMKTKETPITTTLAEAKLQEKWKDKEQK